LAALALVLIGCAGPAARSSSSTSTPPSSPPVGGPTSTPGPVGAIDHSTAATDVILRYEEGGGFVPVEWTASAVPIFTLYGDGTIIFRNPRQAPLPVVGSIVPFHPLRTAKMDEAQIQSLLEFAIGGGGLGTARPNYPNDLVADASSAVFTVNAGGLTKQVTVYALGLETDRVPDPIARKAFLRLRERLSDIDQGGTIKTDVYAPDRYRAIILEGQPGAQGQKAWPWPDISPSEFVPDSDPNASQLRARVVRAADIERLGINPYQGGFVGLPLADPADGQTYTLTVRPLLPDDTP
jgi:hypothetical protein